MVIGPGNGDFLQYLDTKIKYTFIEKSKTFSLQLQKKIDESIGINSELIFGDFLKINIQKKLSKFVHTYDVEVKKFKRSNVSRF